MESNEGPLNADPPWQPTIALTYELIERRYRTAGSRMHTTGQLSRYLECHGRTLSGSVEILKEIIATQIGMLTHDGGLDSGIWGKVVRQ